ncbi:MAG: tyrosine recombinase XerC [Gammaproteobacteria bacterium]|nr:MAG: tyrosine recombinase XerC [Gammaproteobacteria bacterium]RKZ90437.1 MAG: tyrosine recombinase XerC [Gammaproteobacteria bacterium]RKZ96905.1 MAG: tyrosine recombinase XerC [Gammaproteobacteria bacterium]
MASEQQQDTELFLHYLAQEKRMSSHTVTNYQRDLKRFLAFCEQHELDGWQIIKSSHIRRFIAQLHREGLAGRSIQRALSATRSLYRFLIREGLADNNPAQAVQAPKVEKRLPATLDVDQMSGLLDLNQQDTVISCRDHAIMELFYSSGLRLAELAGLNLRDIDFGDQLVYVTGKGNKSRLVPVGSQAIGALQKWLTKRDQLGFFEQAALFITQQGKRLGVRSIQKRISFWGKKQGISEHVHPHRLRHAFASHMLEASGDLRAVQELLGHADISTTQIYTHVDFQHLAKVYDSAHPRARKK